MPTKSGICLRNLANRRFTLAIVALLDRLTLSVLATLVVVSCIGCSSSSSNIPPVNATLVDHSANGIDKKPNFVAGQNFVEGPQVGCSAEDPNSLDCCPDPTGETCQESGGVSIGICDIPNPLTGEADCGNPPHFVGSPSGGGASSANWNTTAELACVRSFGRYADYWTGRQSQFYCRHSSDPSGLWVEAVDPLDFCAIQVHLPNNQTDPIQVKVFGSTITPSNTTNRAGVQVNMPLCAWYQGYSQLEP